MVLRLLRGETLEEVSRDENVTVAELSKWRESFLEAGKEGLKQKPKTSKEVEYQQVIGKLQMENELLKKRVVSRAKGVCPSSERNK